MDGSKSPRTPVRLAPPPRVAAGSHDSIAAGGVAPKGKNRGPGYWLTLLVFAGLGVIALGVFVVLPDWVAARPEEPVEESRVEVSGGREAASADAGSDGIEEPPPAETPALPSAETRTGPAGDQSVQRIATQPVEPRVKAPDPVAVVFASAMAAGLSHLERGDLAEARRAFEEARATKPDSGAAMDALTRVGVAEQLKAIAEHEQRAVAFEAEESWGSATREYEAVLALDEIIRFAQDGQVRAAARHSLDQRLRGHISHPDRLSDDDVLEDAQDALSAAGEISPGGAVLAQQIDQLVRIVKIASTPVRVTLLSDEITEVLVYRHGVLGAFKRKELDLRPGTYTVVGSRRGFRDVRFRLEVNPDAPPAPLTVRCEEKI